ncbi:citryl-CoA lyase [Noviherbaspirillum saxi]|uniref:citrate synthase (unknown stereospecificity) n=1 Tax=Noviherbaspirillum saxi TaxID=2320863 RepID=A0A3A3FZ54_9BURK|nr:citryl-CoA lyase [Noviherbaspirillum saxi]RJF92369.1 citryl-CoA lyase [Noviherbaspirillum saxi]
MSLDKTTGLLKKAREWWTTKIIDIRPGIIRIKGTPIQDLIGNVSYAHMVWLMTRDDQPTPEQAALLEAALVSAVDHGPQAPSIAISRMAVTCGLPLNGAMASAINVLDDVHGGAGEQCLELFNRIARHPAGLSMDDTVTAVLDEYVAEHGKIIPGYGHRFHPVDPRAIRLLALVDAAAKQGVVRGRYADIGRAVEAALAQRASSKLPMNIDGATAVVYGELGFEPAMARGLFILSRSVGILAHAWEQKQQGGRIKGPMPPDIDYTYTGA